MSKTKIEDKTINIVLFILFVLIVIITLYPFLYILVNSLNEGIDAAKGGIYFWPRKFTLANYVEFFSSRKWLMAALISVLRTGIGTVITVFFTCLMAYGLAQPKLLFKNFYFAVVVFCMYFSGGIIPFYVLLRSLHLINTFWVYVIPGAVDLFFIFIAVSSFREIPYELTECAKLDGASDVTIFFRIALPISKPTLATMFLFIGVNQWNSWVDSAYYVRADELRTLSYRLMEVINQASVSSSGYTMNASNTTSLSVQLAAMMVATVPIMCIYPFLQKYFIKGIMLGAVKG